MAMSRSLGATLLTMRSPIWISPELIGSSPAIIASSVDLPQPDGPTSTTNSPVSTSRLMSFSTSTAPKLLYSLLTESDAMITRWLTPYLMAPCVRPRTKYRPPKK